MDRSSDLHYLLHSRPLSSIISFHDRDYHKYAHDTENADKAPPSDLTSAQLNSQTCINDALLWM